MAKVEFLNLGAQPLANNLLTSPTDKETLYNLRLFFDDETKEVTTTAMNIDPETMFNEKYPYRAGLSKTFTQHLQSAANSIKLLPTPPKFKGINFLEIGSNDGTLLFNFDSSTSIAIEPCKNFAKETNNKGYKTYAEFWTNDLAQKLLEEHGRIPKIFSSNTFSHIPTIKEAFKAISTILHKDGIFILEDPSLIEVLKRNSYDQFYDEHPTVFSITAIHNLLQGSGLEIFNVQRLPHIHGGSNRVYIGHIGTKQISPLVQQVLDLEAGVLQLDALRAFASSVEANKNILMSMLKEYKKQGKTIISYGATAKSATVFNFCGIDKTLIDYILDTTPEKVDKFAPGTHIPIKSYSKDLVNNADIAFLGAWNFLDEIIKNEKEFIHKGGAFITHTPNVRFII